MTEGVSGTLDFLEGLYKSFVWDNILKGAMTMFYAWPPIGTFCAFPLISIPLNIVTQFVWDKLFAVQKLLVDLTDIKFINPIHQKAFDSASLKLKIASIEKGVSSDEYKAALKQEKIDFSKFIGVTR